MLVPPQVLAEELPAFPEPVPEDYAEMTELQLKDQFTNYDKVSQHSTTIAGEAAIVHTCSFGTDVFKQTRALFLKDRLACRLSHTATPESYDEDIDFD